MSTGLLRGMLTDDNGQWDVAYVSLFMVMLATVGPIVLMTVMTMVAHFRCTPHELVAKTSEAVTVITCVYDPQPLGTAIGLACGGFGVALGALAAYMAMTRRPAGSSSTTVRTETITPAAAPSVVPTEPVKVDIGSLPQGG